VVTDNLYHSYIMPSLDLAQEGQSPSGRLWETLSVLRYAIKASPSTDRLSFSVLFTMAPDADPIPIALLAVCGPGDNGQPVISVMLPTDDELHGPSLPGSSFLQLLSFYGGIIMKKTLLVLTCLLSITATTFFAWNDFEIRGNFAPCKLYIRIVIIEYDL